MRVCTICKAKWRGEPAVCPLDGGALEDVPDPLLSRVIGERYVLVERVGAGGMGTVYRARDMDERRDAAVKVLSQELSAEPTGRARFLREAKAANRIDHPHIIDITDAGETEDGLVFLVMEFLEGDPLSRVIARGALPPPRAVRIATQIASALARAHDLDVVHRDIKPDNVFVLDREGGEGVHGVHRDFVKLLDFGLARVKGELRLTASGSVFGTPEYMAPEQARGGALSGKADLYALGCVLYEMLTGQPPFTGRMSDLVVQHVREPPVPPSQRVGALPPGVEATVLALLDKDPIRRPDAHRLTATLASLAEAMADATGERARASGARLRRDADMESWPIRVARLRELAARAHPTELPGWLARALDALRDHVDGASARQAELDAARTSVDQQERDGRDVEARLTGAIEVLRRDEARAEGELEEHKLRLDEARVQRERLEPHLRVAWAALSPPGPEPLSPSPVEGLAAAGQIAAAWLAARRAEDVWAPALAARAQVRRDVQFQRIELEQRLAAHRAEVAAGLSALRARARQLEEATRAEAQEALALATPVIEHLAGHPGLEEAARDLAG